MISIYPLDRRLGRCHVQSRYCWRAISLWWNPPHKNWWPRRDLQWRKTDTTPRWAPRKREWQYVYHPMCKQSLPVRPRAVWVRLPASRTESATSPRCPPRRVLRHQHPTTCLGRKVQFPKRFLTKISFLHRRGVMWCNPPHLCSYQENNPGQPAFCHPFYILCYTDL